MPLAIFVCVSKKRPWKLKVETPRLTSFIFWSLKRLLGRAKGKVKSWVEIMEPETAHAIIESFM